MANNIFPVSIEKFAAYLDGNLSADEMQEMSAIVSSDSCMRDIISASEIVDNTVEQYSPEDIAEFHETIESTPFSLPELDAQGLEPMADFFTLEEGEALAYSDSEAVGSIAQEDTHDHKSFQPLESGFDDMQLHIGNHEAGVNYEINHEDNQYGDLHNEGGYEGDDSHFAAENFNEDIVQF